MNLLCSYRYTFILLLICTLMMSGPKRTLLSLFGVPEILALLAFHSYPLISPFRFLHSDPLLLLSSFLIFLLKTFHYLPLTCTSPFPLWPEDGRLPVLPQVPEFGAISELGLNITRNGLADLTVRAQGHVLLLR